MKGTTTTRIIWQTGRTTLSVHIQAGTLGKPSRYLGKREILGLFLIVSVSSVSGKRYRKRIGMGAGYLGRLVISQESGG